MACEYCEGTRPIRPYAWTEDRAGENPGIIIERGFNVDTGKEQHISGYFIDIDEDLEPDAYFRFGFCPMCGEKLGGDA